MRLFELSKRKALITGGSRGPGRAMAEGFMEAGAQIAIASSTDSTFATAEELEDMFGAEVVAIRADLSNHDQLHRAFDGCLAELGSLDIQLVNHSIQRRQLAENFPIEDWDATLEVNLTSMVLLNQLAGRFRLSKGSGKIIIIASVLTYFGVITVPAYATAREGVGHLTRALSNEWADRGVNVNAIAPG